MIDELVEARGLRLRLRVPTQRGTDPGTVLVDVQLGEPPVSIDGCQVLELTFANGASADNGVVTSADAGGAMLRLVDPSRLFDPTNDESTFSGIGTTIRILLNGVVAFRGRVDDVSHDLTIASLTLVDGIAALAGVQFSETNVPAESTSSRIVRILDLAAWPADRRDIGTGGRPLQAGTVSADAWSELLKVTRNELGALWMTADGRVAWRNRTTAWTGGDPVMAFGCTPSDAYIGDMTTRSDQSDLVNILSAARRTGTQATVTDETSLALYGRHSHVQNDLELSTDDERDLWSDFYLIRQANPATGIAGFSTRPDTLALTKLLGLPLGAIVTVYDEHHGPTIDRRARWLGSKWKVTPSYVEVDAVVGEDASITQIARTANLDTPAEWQAAVYRQAVVTGGALGPGFGSLLPNGSFESDMTGWSPTAGATISTVAADVVHGTKALKIVGTGAGYPGASATGGYYPVVPGAAYRLRLWAKRILGGVGISFVASIYTVSSTGVVTNYALQLIWNGALNVGSYQEGWYLVPATGVAAITVQLFISNAAAPATEGWSVDDVSLVGGNVRFDAPGLTYWSVPAE